MKHGYKANLDLLRAAAILMVIVYHISQFCPAIPSEWKAFFSLGTFGVDLFFVLSGWLIGGIFFREYQQLGYVDMVRFWGRRWVRTMLPYYVALLISWLAVYVIRHQPFTADYLFFLQNYDTMPPFFVVSWSLCIEEHFYIFLPLVLYIGLTFDAVVVTCLALMAVSLLARLSSVGAGYPDFGYLLTATHFRLDGLSLGVLCAYIYTLKSPVWHRFSFLMTRVGMVSGVAGVLIHFLNGQLMYTFGISLLSAGCAGLLCQAVNAPDWRAATHRGTALIANTSYSLYLTHALAIHIVTQFIPGGSLVFIASAWVSIVLAAWLFYIGVEGAAKTVRDRFFPPLVSNVVMQPHRVWINRNKRKGLAGLLGFSFRTLTPVSRRARIKSEGYTTDSADLTQASS